MKKIISLALVLILLLSFCSCKKEESGASASPDSLVENNKPETNEPEVQKPETKDPEIQEPEKQQPEVQEPEKQQPEEQIPENTQPENVPENQESSVVEYENIYSDSEILVTLTDEESAHKKAYSVSDFQNLDISYVYELGNYTKHYVATQTDFDIHKNKTSLILYLNSPSHENMQKYIDILNNDSRVYQAMPNALSFSVNGEIEFSLSEYKDHNKISEILDEIKNILSECKINKVSNSFYIHLSDKTTKNVINSMDLLKKQQNISNVHPYYAFYFNAIFIHLTTTDENKEYTIEDFPELQLESIQQDRYTSKNDYTDYYIQLKPKDPTPHNLKKYENILRKNYNFNSIRIGEGIHVENT